MLHVLERPRINPDSHFRRLWIHKMTPISFSPYSILLVPFNEPYGVLEDSWSNVLLADANQMGVSFFVP